MYKLNVAESLTFFYSWIRKLILLNFFFLIFLGLFRVAAWIYYGDSQGLEGQFDQVLEAFILGFRYDLSLLAVISVLPLFYLFLLTLKRNERRLENYGPFVFPFYFLCFFIVSLFMALDFGLYSFTQNHLLISWFAHFAHDAETAFANLWSQVSPLALSLSVVIGLVYVWLVYKLTKRILSSFRLKQSFVQKSSFNYVPAFILPLALTAWAAWGSVSHERLTPPEASFSNNDFVNFLAGNGLLFLAQNYETPKSTLPELNSSQPQSMTETLELLEFNPTKDQQ